MLTKKQIRLLATLRPGKEYTFKEIKGEETSNATIQQALTTFLKEQLVTRRAVADIYLYSLNHNARTHAYLELAYQEQLKHIRKQLETILAALDKTNLFYTAAVFGSYAKGTQTKDSDLDVVVIADDVQQARIALNEAKLGMIVELHGFAFTPGEFKEMIENNFFNVGKEIQKNSIPIRNITAYMRLVHGAVSAESQERAYSF